MKLDKVTAVNESRLLDMDKLMFASKPISTKEAIEDDEPFDWTEDVIAGRKRVTL